ncbi:MAG: NADH-quinone oxidoreductase subunit A [Leptospirillum sp.]|uniref:NADH-quinone oxidoreductase subunit A n=1 Tax=Leptospirillum ferriphilum TaxID=178606 RepID=K4EPB6_9BACT|nr:NADH quinone oxidoreductase A subunit [Leptospirillum ferriphilum]
MFSLSHPEHYVPILLFLLVAIGFGAISLTVGKLIRPKNPYKDKNAPYECGVPPINDARERFSIRYYVIAMLFLVFDVEVVFLYPWAVDFSRLGLFGLVEMMIFIFILLIGYVYAWKKEALEWD